MPLLMSTDQSLPVTNQDRPIDIESEGRHGEFIRLGGTMDYRKCIACQKGWQSEKSASNRVAWCRTMLDRYPTPQKWKRVRFSDEVHYGYGAQGPLCIIRKPGERYCPDCIQRKEGPTESEKKKVHAWAAVGYNFKSPIVFYNVKGNTNGKMSLQVYQDQILNPIVKPWIGDDFVLEEDGDSGHGTGKKNIIRSWKKDHGLQYYFNCASSPDLSPIENCWQPTKNELHKYPHWDESTTKSLILDAWKDRVTKDYINSRIRSIPLRLKDVIDSDEQMAAEEWITENIDDETHFRYFQRSD